MAFSFGYTETTELSRCDPYSCLTHVLSTETQTQSQNCDKLIKMHTTVQNEATDTLTII